MNPHYRELIDYSLLAEEVGHRKSNRRLQDRLGERGIGTYGDLLEASSRYARITAHRSTERIQMNRFLRSVDGIGEVAAKAMMTELRRVNLLS
jgi:hypothetical protein